MVEFVNSFLFGLPIESKSFLLHSHVIGNIPVTTVCFQKAG